MTDTDPRCPEILALREQGYSWDRIGQHFGMSYSTARELVDPAFALQRRQRQRARHMRKTCGYAPSVERLSRQRCADRVSPDDIKARFAEIPPDTRPLGARLMGDPIPGRSALDQMRQRHG